MAASKKATQQKNETIPRPQRARKAALVLPTYSLKDVQVGEVLAIRVMSEIIDKEDFDHKTGERKLDKKTKEPAFLHLVQVVDIDTGEVGEMVLPCIIHNAFERAGELTGRCFELVKGEEKTGSATKWQVYEIDA